MELPLAFVAVDLGSGKKWFYAAARPKGDRASCAIPGIFCPVKIDGKLLVDGRVLDRVPAGVVKEMGADLVIAVDVDSFATEYKINHIFDVLSKTIEIMSREISAAKQQVADVVITPDLSDIAPFHFHRASEIIARGEEAARQALPLLRKLKHGKNHGKKV